MQSKLFEHYNYLASFNPYYSSQSEDKKFYETFKEAAEDVSGPLELDVLAIIEVLNKYYMFADRTIFKRIKRSPWMAKFDSRNSKWTYEKLPKHGHYDETTAEAISERLFELLCDEILSYINGSQVVGILLSGGMDSRIVAGILKFLISNGKISSTKVTAFTWGNYDSRDVIYSKKITDLFDWEWKHYIVGPDQLWNNLKIAGERGCEFTGIHLHAIPQIAEDLDTMNIDVMLAGSYGDSVGRAEYSGRHVTQLNSIQANMENPAFLLKSSVYKQYKYKWNEDIARYHNLFPRDESYQQKELDYQLHYMRRMLNPCMELINEKVPLRQVFTAPKVFGYMWGIDPLLRNDEIYEHLLKKLHPELKSIPWARTGLKYPKRSGEPDKYKKKHHSYSNYIQQNLIDRIQDRLTDHMALKKNIINTHAVHSLIKLVKYNNDYNFDYIEKLTWLLSFSYMLDCYNIKISKYEKNKHIDKFKAKFILPLEYKFYHTGRRIRSLFL